MDVSGLAAGFGPAPIGSFVDLAQVRQRLAHWLLQVADLGADADLDDVLVVVSELGSNAVNANPPGRSALLAAELRDDHLCIEATNDVHSRSVVHHDVGTHDPLHQRGRGLLLVRALSDDVSVDAEGDKVTVRATVRLAWVCPPEGAKARRRLRSRRSPGTPSARR